MHFLLRFFFFLDIFYFALRCRAGAFLLTILCKITWMCASSCQWFRHDEAIVYSCETIVKVLRTSNIVCFYLFLKGTVVVLLYSYFSIKFWLLLCSVAFSAYSVSVAYTYFFYIYIYKYNSAFFAPLSLFCSWVFMLCHLLTENLYAMPAFALFL